MNQYPDVDGGCKTHAADNTVLLTQMHGPNIVGAADHGSKYW